MQIQLLPGLYSICLLAKQPESMRDILFYAYTEQEISLVCCQGREPADCLDIQPGWRALRVKGPLDFTLTGILSELSGLLAAGKIGIFAVSTYLTDYILIKSQDAARAARLLRAGGHIVSE